MKGYNKLEEKERELIKTVMEGSTDMKFVLFEKLEKELRKDTEVLVKKFSCEAQGSAKVEAVAAETKAEQDEAQAPEKEEEVKKSKKASKTSKKNKKTEYSMFFGEVRKTGYRHGDKLPENAPTVLTSCRKDTDACVVAALVNNHGIATNAVWGTGYKYPIVFGKLSLNELEAIKEDIIANFPENAERIGENTTENGKSENFYYDEIEEGNFCNRIIDKDGKITYFGYIVDQNLCFYRNPDESTIVVDMEFFFMPKWGTKASKEDYEVKIEAINSLIKRAFDTDNVYEDIEANAIIEEAEKQQKAYKESHKSRRGRRASNLTDEERAENIRRRDEELEAEKQYRESIEGQKELEETTASTESRKEKRKAHKRGRKSQKKAPKIMAED